MTSKKYTTRRTGRPEKQIDWERVDNLLMAGCQGTEIAPHFDLHPQTFYDRVEKKYNMSFTDYCSLKRQKGNSLLKEAQFEKALTKDNTMLIWLGKQRLDQREPGTLIDTTQTSEEIKVTIAEIKQLDGQCSIQPKSSPVIERFDVQD